MLQKIIPRKIAEYGAPLLYSRFFKGFAKQEWKGKKFALTLGFDIDYPEDVIALPKLLDLLSENSLVGSFAAVGKFIELNPAPFKRIVEEGHELVNHSYSHPNGYFNPDEFFHKLPKYLQEEEIKKCHDICVKKLGYSPLGFRTPHFGDQHCESVYPLLKKLGYVYSSSTLLTRTKGLPFYPTPDGVLELPVMTCPMHYFPVFDSFHCFRTQPPAHPKKGEFIELFKKALIMAGEYGYYANFYFDPMDVVRKEEFIECLQEARKADAFTTTSLQVARLWKKEHSQ